eukprot:TRINITY_DN58243_c0_g1_i1.p1 TRINITY_DN58243_c0_g1~~TRINITY_DN58243_c0_g1_i1.p1  ORF type:complete len:187 (-),score=14.44 TRINITY_DN58243_c0_g1_i1:233-793(-)
MDRTTGEALPVLVEHVHHNATGRPETGASRRSARSSARSQGHHSSGGSSVISSVAHSTLARQQGRDYVPILGSYAANSTVGYTGFIPGRISENVHGGTHQVETLHATMGMSLMRSGLSMTSPRGFERPLPGTEIPGYMGCAPNRHGENVHGQTLSRAAERAWALKAAQAQERQQRVRRYRQWGEER